MQGADRTNPSAGTLPPVPQSPAAHPEPGDGRLIAPSPHRPIAPSPRRPVAAPWLTLAGAVVLVAAMGWLFVAGGLETLLGSRDEARPLSAGNRAPALSLPSADGPSVSLEAYKGQPVVVNFWATWCLPCRVEMPELEAAYRSRREQGLVVLAVNLGEEQEAVDAYRREVGVSFPLLLDQLGRTTAEYGVQGLPTTFFIGRDGRITHIHNGAIGSSTLEAQLQRIVS